MKLVFSITAVTKTGHDYVPGAITGGSIVVGP